MTEETREEMINRLKAELGDQLQETYEVQCAFHGKITGTFDKFLDNPSGCKQCIKQGMVLGIEISTKHLFGKPSISSLLTTS